MAATSDPVISALEALELDTQEYISLLGLLIGETESLQNSPLQGLVPREDQSGQHVLAHLDPYSTANGGPLEIEHVSFVEGRGNIIIKYRSGGGAGPDSGPLPQGEPTIAFVGSHLDVVPANPELWERDPFALSVEGDKLYGRGTTDSLGHVAVITCLFKALAVARPALSRTVVAVFIASEEGGDPGVGVDALMAAGKLDFLRAGPIVWVDSADSQPCIGTATSLTWELKAIGKLFHSGLPHRGINSIELLSEALAVVQRRFYEDFPAHPRETDYKFSCSSTLKPTQISCASGSLNQICPHSTASGDVRMTPFYDTAEVRARVQQYINDINADIEQLPTRGPHSKYTLPDGPIRKGLLEWKWSEVAMEGIACSIDSQGYHALCEAVAAVNGECEPYSISGSLPLVKEMQEGGFDVQIIGFGLSSTYHADNEYSLLSDFQKAFRVLARVITYFQREDALTPPRPPQ